MGFIYLVVAFVLFLIGLLIAKSIFRINEIVDQLQRQNALLVRMLKREGASNQEIRDTLSLSTKLKEVLKD
jgi:predicted Holliday junction resolvase-like endonuclease